MKTLRVATLSFALLIASGCCATIDVIQSDYTAADRATYEVIAPAFLKYVQDDSSLDDEQKKRRERTVATWRLRLEQAEGPAQPTTEGQ